MKHSDPCLSSRGTAIVPNDGRVVHGFVRAILRLRSVHLPTKETLCASSTSTILAKSVSERVSRSTATHAFCTPNQQGRRQMTILKITY